MTDLHLLDETPIPVELRPKAREWFARQMARCAASHGTRWPDHREWLADYLNAELAEHLAKKEGAQ